MTIHFDPRPAPTYPAAPVRSRRARRLAVPAGLVALATVAVFGVAQLDDTHDEVRSPAVDYTRAQVLVQRSIDDALATNQAAALSTAHGPVWRSNNHSVAASVTQHNATRAQVLIQQYIDEALAANRSSAHGEFTRAQVLIQQSIDDALAARD